MAAKKQKITFNSDDTNHQPKTLKPSGRSKRLAAKSIRIQIQCKICKQTFKNQSALRSHTTEMHKTKTSEVHQCSFCEKHLRHTNELKKHIKSVHESAITKQKQCFYCSEIYKDEKSLKIHIGRKHDKDNQCEFCEKKCRRLSELRAHLQMHESAHAKNNATALICSICVEQHQNESSLKKHIGMKHQRKVTEFKDSFDFTKEMIHLHGMKSNNIETETWITKQLVF